MPVRPSDEDWSEETRAEPDDTTQETEDQAEVEEAPEEWCCQDEEKAGWGDGEKVP